MIFDLASHLGITAAAARGLSAAELQEWAAYFRQLGVEAERAAKRGGR